MTAPTLRSLAEQKADDTRDLPEFREFSLPGFRDQITLLLSMIGHAGIFHTYTRHDISHIDAMLRMLKWLIPEPTQKKMTPADWLLIVLAVYLHDLGMLVTQEEFEARHENAVYREWLEKLQRDDKDRDYLARARGMRPDEQERFFFQEYVRWGHAARIREWILNQHSRRWSSGLNAAAAEVHRLLLPLPYRFRQYLGTVCESHHEDKLEDAERFPVYAVVGSDTEREWVNVQYAAILLRTADLLHITRDRAPSVMFKRIKFTDPRGVAEWEKQRGTFSVAPKKLRWDPDDPSTAEIQISADFTEERPLFALQVYIVYANAQVEQSRRWVEKSQEEGAKDYLFPWLTVKGDVQLEGVKPFPLKFELDRGKLLDLLVGHTLYNDPTVAVRELLQNAIDAVRYRHHLDRREAAAAGRPAPLMGGIRVCWDPESRRLLVEDNGVGMNKDVVENHLMKVGSSYYNTQTFEVENADFAPISRFGIGILTCFMVSDNIEIVTCRDGRGHRIRMTSVHADYLRRELQQYDQLLDGIEPHGTRVTLAVRESVDLSKRSVADIVRYWVILPECRVEYVETGKDPEPIGFHSAEEALESYHRTEKAADRYKWAQLGVISKRRAFPRDGDGPSGEYELALGVVSSWFPEKAFADRLSEELPAVCVEGIRVSNRLPSAVEGSAHVSALLAVRGNRALRTTVSRSALEDDFVANQLGRLCLQLMMEHIRDEVKRLSELKGHPLSQASTACMFLCRQLRTTLASAMFDAFDAEKKQLPALVLERLVTEGDRMKAVRELHSRAEVGQLEEFWSVESRLVDSLGLISRDLGRELSLNEFTTALAPDVAYLRFSPIVPDGDQFKSDLIRMHHPALARYSRRHQQTAVCWRKCTHEDRARTDFMFSCMNLPDRLRRQVAEHEFRTGELVQDIYIWITSVEGDSEPIVDVVRTRWGVIIRPESRTGEVWNTIREVLLHLTQAERLEDLLTVTQATNAFDATLSGDEYLHRHHRQQGDIQSIWRSGLQVMRRVLGEMALRADLPDELVFLEQDLVFDAQRYWRDWRGER